MVGDLGALEFGYIADVLFVVDVECKRLVIIEGNAAHRLLPGWAELIVVETQSAPPGS
jgi:hypothetical protein